MKRLLALTVAVLLCLTATAFAADQIDLEKAMLLDKAGKQIAAKGVFAGKISAVAFAQTACAVCREEIQYLNGVLKDYPKLNLVATIVDMRPNEARVDGYLGELGFKGQVLTDPGFAFASSVGVNQTPSLIIVDKAGKVVFRSSGYDAATGKKIAEALKAQTF